jgi:hypothetical protein
MEKYYEEQPHLPFVTLNLWDKVCVVFGKAATSTSNIGHAEANAWSKVDVSNMNIMLRAVKKFCDDIVTYTHEDAPLPASKAPSWTPASFNPRVMEQKRMLTMFSGQTNRTNTTNRTTLTNNRTNANNKTNGATNQQGGGSAKKQRTELTQAQKKGTVLTKDASYKATIDDVVGPNKDQCKQWHLYGEECTEGNGCKFNHDHIRGWTESKIEAYVKHLLARGKMYLNRGLQKDDVFMAKFSKINVQGKEVLFSTRGSGTTNGASN